jgi:hypothetical protein
MLGLESNIFSFDLHAIIKTLYFLFTDSMITKILVGRVDAIKFPTLSDTLLADWFSAVDFHQSNLNILKETISSDLDVKLPTTNALEAYRQYSSLSTTMFTQIAQQPFIAKVVILIVYISKVSFIILNFFYSKYNKYVKTFWSILVGCFFIFVALYTVNKSFNFQPMNREVFLRMAENHNIAGRLHEIIKKTPINITKLIEESQGNYYFEGLAIIKDSTRIKNNFLKSIVQFKGDVYEYSRRPPSHGSDLKLFNKVVPTVIKDLTKIQNEMMITLTPESKWKKGNITFDFDVDKFKGGPFVEPIARSDFGME